MNLGNVLFGFGLSFASIDIVVMLDGSANQSPDVNLDPSPIFAPTTPRLSLIAAAFSYTTMASPPYPGPPNNPAIDLVQLRGSAVMLPESLISDWLRINGKCAHSLAMRDEFGPQLPLPL